MLAGMAALGLTAFLMLLYPSLVLIPVGLAGGIAIVWTARRVQGNGAHLLCALLLIEELSAASFLPLQKEQLFMVRYPLLIAFCAVAVWTVLRSPEIWQGGFFDYFIYLSLGVISISYSLLPGYSAARVLAAILMFMGLFTHSMIAQIRVGGPFERELAQGREFFADSEVTHVGLFSLVGSAGFVEIAAQDSSAAKILGAQRGDPVVLYRSR